MPDGFEDHDDQDDLTAETDQDSELVRKLRRQLRDTRKEAKRAADLEKELGDFRKEKAVKDAGLSLTTAQVRALLRDHTEEGREMTAEALTATAVELGFVTPSTEDVPAEDLDTEQAITTAQATGRPANSAGLLAPSDVAGWPVDKQMRFRKQHPDAFEALKRGEQVRVPAFA